MFLISGLLIDFISFFESENHLCRLTGNQYEITPSVFRSQNLPLVWQSEKFCFSASPAYFPKLSTFITKAIDTMAEECIMPLSSFGRLAQLARALP